MTKLMKRKSLQSLALLSLLGLVAPCSFADVSISGYISAIGGVMDKTPPVSYAGYSEEDLTFDQNSLVGIQLSSAISDKLTATVQMVARGNNSWQVDADWAYVSYQVNDNWKIRGGRFRVPFYLYSDFVTVGYAYPWISPPVENYSLPFDNISGMDTIYTTNIKNVDLLFQAYMGTANFDIDAGALAGATGNTRNQFGLVGELSWENFKFRLAHHQAKVSIDTNLLFSTLPAALNPYDPNSTISQAFPDNAARLLYDKDKVTFENAGVQWDNGRFLFIAEKNILDADDQALSAKQDRFYATAGVRFGSFLVHYTWAKRDDPAPDLSRGMPTSGPYAGLTGGVNGLADALIQDSEQSTIGLRWDFTPAAAFKVEYTHQDDNKPGVDDQVNLLRFGVQAVF